MPSELGIYPLSGIRRIWPHSSSVLSAFTAQSGYEPDGCGSARAWLVNRAGMSRGAAAGAIGWEKRLARHARIAAVLAAGDITESCAKEIAGWTDKLPAGKRDEADAILVIGADLNRIQAGDSP